MSDHQQCENPLCSKEFIRRQNGKKQRFCEPACRRQWTRLAYRLGKAVIDVHRPIIQAEARKTVGAGHCACPKGGK